VEGQAPRFAHFPKALIEGYYLPFAEKAAKLGGFSTDLRVYRRVRLRPLVKECFEDAVAPFSFFSLFAAAVVTTNALHENKGRRTLDDSRGRLNYGYCGLPVHRRNSPDEPLCLSWGPWNFLSCISAPVGGVCQSRISGGHNQSCRKIRSTL
jgi:hypothetical protein